VGAWTTVSGLIVTKFETGGGGSQNSALNFGGRPSNSPVVLSCTEAYDGIAWSSKSAMISQIRCTRGAGASANAVLSAGGYLLQRRAEVFDGNSWSSVAQLISGTCDHAVTGVQNSALAFGRYFGTQIYNGTTWRSGNNLITGTKGLAGAGASSDSALAFGGRNFNFPFADVTCTQKYNGVTWSAASAMTTARCNFAASGIENSAVTTGGVGAIRNTERYNGTSWAVTSLLITGRNSFAASSTSGNAALVFGGNDGVGGGSMTTTEAYNEPNIIIGGTFTNYSGSQYSGSVRLLLNGQIDATYNIGNTGFSGSTQVNDYLPLYNGVISNTRVIAVGGFTTYSGSTDLLPRNTQNRLVLLNADGTISGSFTGNIWQKLGEFTETSGSFVTGTGVNSSGATTALFYLVATGSIPANTAITATLTGTVVNKAVSGFAFSGSVLNFSGSGAGSSFNPPSMNFASLPTSSTFLRVRSLAHEGPVTDTFTPTNKFTAFNKAGTPGGVCAWITVNPMTTARLNLAGVGTQTAALGFGGATVTCTEAYNGVSWGARSAMITARGALGAVGTQNAALGFGGTPSVACTEAYNGTAWSVGGALITGRYGLGGAGTQNAALAFGGDNGAAISCTEAYNGTAWSAGAAMITARQSFIGVGTQNAALGFGGLVTCTNTEAYNGSTWTTQVGLITGRNSLGGVGTVSSALAFAGKTPIALSCTEAFNGVGWSTRAVMNSARSNLGGAGTQTSALAFGGEPSTAVTEAFNFSNSYDLTATGEFIIANGPVESQPSYPSGSNSSIYYTFYQVNVLGKTYYILVD
jgi:hypothetical protein